MQTWSFTLPLINTSIFSCRLPRVRLNVCKPGLTDTKLTVTNTPCNSCIQHFQNRASSFVFKKPVKHQTISARILFHHSTIAFLRCKIVLEIESSIVVLGSLQLAQESQQMNVLRFSGSFGVVGELLLSSESSFEFIGVSILALR